MASFQQNLHKLSARGVRVIAVSVDSPDDTRKHAIQQGYTYTFLCDRTAEVIRRWGLLDMSPAGADQDISLSGEFLIDSDGVIRWLNRMEDRRSQAEQLLRVLDELARAHSSAH